MDLSNFAAQDDHFHTIIVINVNVQHRNNEVVESMLQVVHFVA